MDFTLVFKFLIEKFKQNNIDFALIGGFALQAVGLTRTTCDIDLLVLSENAAKIKDVMCRYGYRLIYESDDVLNFLSDKKIAFGNKFKRFSVFGISLFEIPYHKFELGRVDFLLAHRIYTKAMLKRAEEKDILKSKFRIKVIAPEDLIGLKVQSSSNDPGRMRQDMADIEMIVRNNYSLLDMNLVREYFRLFDREKDLDSIIEGIKNA